MFGSNRIPTIEWDVWFVNPTSLPLKADIFYGQTAPKKYDKVFVVSYLLTKHFVDIEFYIQN